MDLTEKIRSDLLAYYGNKIEGCCTPDEFVNIVIDDIIADTAQNINYDYHDMTCALRDASIVDALRVKGAKARIRQLLDMGLRKLSAAHPGNEVYTILLQVQVPEGDLMMADMNVFHEFLDSFGDIDKRWGMGSMGNLGDSIQLTIVIGYK